MSLFHRVAVSLVDALHQHLAETGDPLPSFTAGELMARYDDLARQRQATVDLLRKAESKLAAANATIANITTAAEREMKDRIQSESAASVAAFADYAAQRSKLEKDLKELRALAEALMPGTASKHDSAEETALREWLSEHEV